MTHFVSAKKIRKIPEGASTRAAITTHIENAITCIYALINTLSITLSAYSVVVFTLVFIYSKTAIGMDLDQSFVKFFAATSQFRNWAFYSFHFSTIGFSFSLALSKILRERGKGVLGWIEALPSLIIATVASVHCRHIMDLAGKMIYGEPGLYYSPRQNHWSGSSPAPVSPDAS